MPPRVSSQTFAGYLGIPGFVPHGSRWIEFNATIDMGDLPSLGDRMADVLHARLEARLGDVAHRVVDLAKSKLVPGHGYDTGLMHDNLVAKLVSDAIDALDAVYYDLESDQADYWIFVEFGHMLRNGNWWPGYHFLSSSVIEMEPQIRQAVRDAWGDTVVILASAARVSPHLPIPGLPGVSL